MENKKEINYCSWIYAIKERKSFIKKHKLTSAYIQITADALEVFEEIAKRAMKYDALAKLKEENMMIEKIDIALKELKPRAEPAGTEYMKDIPEYAEALKTAIESLKALSDTLQASVQGCHGCAHSYEEEDIYPCNGCIRWRYFEDRYEPEKENDETV